MRITLKTKIWFTVLTIVLLFSFFSLYYFPAQQEKYLLDNYNTEFVIDINHNTENFVLNDNYLPHNIRGIFLNNVDLNKISTIKINIVQLKCIIHSDLFS